MSYFQSLHSGSAFIVGEEFINTRTGFNKTVHKCKNTGNETTVFEEGEGKWIGVIRDGKTNTRYATAVDLLDTHINTMKSEKHPQYNHYSDADVYQLVLETMLRNVLDNGYQPLHQTSVMDGIEKFSTQVTCDAAELMSTTALHRLNRCLFEDSDKLRDIMGWNEARNIYAVVLVNDVLVIACVKRDGTGETIPFTDIPWRLSYLIINGEMQDEFYRFVSMLSSKWPTDLSSTKPATAEDEKLMRVFVSGRTRCAHDLLANRRIISQSVLITNSTVKPAVWVVFLKSGFLVGAVTDSVTNYTGSTAPIELSEYYKEELFEGRKSGLEKDIIQIVHESLKVKPQPSTPEPIGNTGQVTNVEPTEVAKKLCPRGIGSAPSLKDLIGSIGATKEVMDKVAESQHDGVDLGKYLELLQGLSEILKEGVASLPDEFKVGLSSNIIIQPKVIDDDEPQKPSLKLIVTDSLDALLYQDFPINQPYLLEANNIHIVTLRDIQKGVGSQFRGHSNIEIYVNESSRGSRLDYATMYHWAKMLHYSLPEDQRPTVSDIKELKGLIDPEGILTAGFFRPK